MLYDNAVSESDLRGILLNAIQAPVGKLGKTVVSVLAKDFGLVDEFHIGGNFRLNFIIQGGISRD